MYQQLEKKLVKWQYLLHMPLQYGELQPSNGSDLLASLGHPSKFQRISHLGFVTAATSLTAGQPSFARCLAVSWAGILYIHFLGFLPPDGIFSSCKIHFCLAFSYIGGVSVWHWSNAREPNFAALSRGCHLYSAGRPSCCALAHILVLKSNILKTVDIQSAN